LWQELIDGGFPWSRDQLRRLAPVRFVLCASPGYVKQHGAPRQPDDLSSHRCLFYSLRAIPGEWRFVGPEGEIALRISGRFRSNSGNMLYAAMLAGAGIGMVPTFVAGRDLAEGRLVSLMPDYQPVESELSAIYPPGKAPRRHCARRRRWRRRGSLPPVLLECLSACRH
jgi:DNA-binding transcriptional LysR family regulator